MCLISILWWCQMLAMFFVVLLIVSWDKSSENLGFVYWSLASAYNTFVHYENIWIKDMNYIVQSWRNYWHTSPNLEEKVFLLLYHNMLIRILLSEPAVPDPPTLTDGQAGKDYNKSKNRCFLGSCHDWFSILNMAIVVINYISCANNFAMILALANIIVMK